MSLWKSRPRSRFIEAPLRAGLDRRFNVRPWLRSSCRDRSLSQFGVGGALRFGVAVPAAFGIARRSPGARRWRTCPRTVCSRPRRSSCQGWNSRWSRESSWRPKSSSTSWERVLSSTSGSVGLRSSRRAAVPTGATAVGLESAQASDARPDRLISYDRWSAGFPDRIHGCSTGSPAQPGLASASSNTTPLAATAPGPRPSPQDRRCIRREPPRTGGSLPQLHTVDYRSLQEFAGRRVIVICRSTSRAASSKTPQARAWQPNRRHPRGGRPAVT